MLRWLSIRNFVIVEQLDLELDAGFTVITGETGAGKSILIDALSLILGARGEVSLIRAGKERAELSAQFSIAHNRLAQECLSTYAIEHDNSVLLRRILYQDGRSRAFINGTTVTVNELKVFAESLVDIYSQNIHHSLLKTSVQQALLDSFAGNDALLYQLNQAFQEWQTCYHTLADAQHNAVAHQEELARLREEYAALHSVALSAPDWLSLNAEHTKLSHQAELMHKGTHCLHMLAETEPCALDLTAHATRIIEDLHQYDAGLSGILDTLRSATIHLQESTRHLARYLTHTQLNEQALSTIEETLQTIHLASRKYRVAPENMHTHLAEIKDRISVLATFFDHTTLAAKAEQTHAAYLALAQTLTSSRAATAQKLTNAMQQQLAQLALTDCHFVVDLSPCPAHASGQEHVEFLIATQSGSAPRPLNKIVSGGELSRFSLGLRVVTAQASQTPTMIFDEVDVGIGGRVAEVVGKLLKSLGGANTRQVFVITHLPQVAALGTQHLQVLKHSIDGKVTSTIKRLSHAERVEELARMLGGLQVTTTTRQHAQELLALAVN